MKEENEKELLELMRAQQRRIEDRRYDAEVLRKWAMGFGAIAFAIYCFIVVASPDNGEETHGEFNSYIWAILICLGVGALFWVASYFKEP